MPRLDSEAICAKRTTQHTQTASKGHTPTKMIGRHNKLLDNGQADKGFGGRARQRKIRRARDWGRTRRTPTSSACTHRLHTAQEMARAEILRCCRAGTHIACKSNRIDAIGLRASAVAQRFCGARASTWHVNGCRRAIAAFLDVGLDCTLLLHRVEIRNEIFSATDHVDACSCTADISLHE